MPVMRHRRVNRLLATSAALACAFGASAAASAEDSYLLALTWLPTFCGAGDHAGLPECKASSATAPRFVLHGLWPDWDMNGDGKRDAADDFCVTGDPDRKAIIDLDGQSARAGNWLALPELKLSAASSNDLQGVMPGTASGLERHEWWKHGTCSGLAQEEYFATAILLVREVERSNLARVIAQQAGDGVDRNKLLAAFESDFGANTSRALTLDCQKTADGAALLEIRIRLKRETVTQGLNTVDLDVPQEAPSGNCAAEVRIPDWRHQE